MMKDELGDDRSRTTKSPGSAWDRWDQILGNWLPYSTLAASTILCMTQPNQTWGARVEMIALAALAAVWVYLLYNRTPEPRRAHPGRMRIYFTGFLVISTFLMVRYPVFFIFTISGFFIASLLRPWALTVLGVATTSILLNTVNTGFPWPTQDAWYIFPPIIIIQTITIGFGSVIGEKLADVSELRKQAVARLEAALAENAGLHAQLVAQAREAGILEERQRLARDIHDTLAQGLIGIITQLEATQQAFQRSGDWQRHLNHAVDLARESLAEARRSVNALRPEPLENARLPDALADVAHQWSDLNNVPIEVTTCGEPIALHPEIEAALLRTAQEALSNISKHARASRAGLTLSYMEDVVTLDVRDNGTGFTMPTEPTTRKESYGLVTMRQRVNRVAGSLEIESEPGIGTAVSARVPAIPLQVEGSKQ